MLSDDLVERVTHQIEEVGVGADDPSLQIELDDGLGAVNGFPQRIQLSALCVEGDGGVIKIDRHAG